MFINGFKAVENLQNNDIHMDTRYILIFIYPTWYNLTDLIIYHLVTELVTEDVLPFPDLKNIPLELVMVLLSCKTVSTVYIKVYISV